MKPLGVSDPRRIGPYRIFAQLGRGGMGRVFLAGAPDGRLVALKLVHAQHVEDPGFRERFRREVAASRRVSGAYTAPVVDADVETEIPWLVTVFVPGPSLRQAIDETGALPSETAARLAAGLASALGEIHAAGLVHRDLKPSNVLLAADGPRVIDFGVARATDGSTSELTHTGWLVGSPGYMSPEQAESKTLTPASDIFSLGAVVYMACTGTEPFMGASTPATLYNVVHAEPAMDAVPEELRGIVGACLAKDPAARPTPEQLLARIGDVPALTRTWPDAVDALITEQHEAVVTALRDGGAPPDVAVVPLLPADHSSSETGERPAGVTAWASRAPEGSTVAGGGRGADGGSRGRRSRRGVIAVLAVAALAVGGTAASLLATSSGGSPSAANAPESALAVPVASPSTSDSDSADSAAAAAPSTADSTTDSNADSVPATDVPTQAGSKPTTPTRTAIPTCLGDKEAYALAEKKNGSMPDDARITVLRCDGNWAGGQLSSVTDGNAEIVYLYQAGTWTAIDLGSDVCTGPVDKAPSDVRKSVNC